ncbi:unnamed protein product, partial [Symbiodinium sp. CCMP2456]
MKLQPLLEEVQSKNKQLRLRLSELRWPQLACFSSNGRTYSLPLRAESRDLLLPPSASVLAYLAGFFDGDGCVSCERALSGCALVVSQTFDQAEVLMLFHETFGGSITLKDIGMGLRKPLLQWRARGQSARRVAFLLAPHSITKREQLWLTSRWPETKSQRRDCKAELRVLKKRDSAVTGTCSWSYFAGFFDAEGCISQPKQGVSQVLGIRQKHPKVLEMIRDFLAGTSGIESTLASGKSSHALWMYGLTKCKQVLQHLLQAGLLCKAKQAELAVSLTSENAAQVSTQLTCLTGNQKFGKRLDAAGHDRARRIKAAGRQASRCEQRGQFAEAKAKQAEVEVLKEEHELLKAHLENEQLVEYTHKLESLHRSSWAAAAVAEASHTGNWPEAVKVMEDIWRLGRSPHGTLLQEAIVVCGEKAWAWALELMERAWERGPPVTPALVDAVLGCLSLAWRSALDLLQDMPRRQLQPTLFSYSRCMNACAEGVQRLEALGAPDARPWRFAVQLLSEAQAHGIQEDTVLDNTLMRCLAKRWRVGQELLSRMQLFGPEPSAATHSTAARLLGEGAPAQASALLHRLVAEAPRGAEPDLSSVFNAALRGLQVTGSWQHGLDVAEMYLAEASSRGWRRDPSCSTNAMMACRGPRDQVPLLVELRCALEGTSILLFIAYLVSVLLLYVILLFDFCSYPSGRLRLLDLDAVKEEADAEEGALPMAVDPALHVVTTSPSRKGRPKRGRNNAASPNTSPEKRREAPLEDSPVTGRELRALLEGHLASVKNEMSSAWQRVDGRIDHLHGEMQKDREEKKKVIARVQKVEVGEHNNKIKIEEISKEMHGLKQEIAESKKTTPVHAGAGAPPSDPWANYLQEKQKREGGESHYPSGGRGEELSEDDKKTLIVGGWCQDSKKGILIEESKPLLVKEEVRSLVDQSELLVWGPRRSFGALKFKNRPGEDDAKVRDRMWGVIKALRASPLPLPSTAAANNGTAKHMWIQFVKTKEARRPVMNVTGEQALFGTMNGNLAIANVTGVAYVEALQENIGAKNVNTKCPHRSFASWNLGGQSIMKADFTLREFDLVALQEVARSETAGWDEQQHDNFTWLSHRHPLQWRGVAVGVASDLLDCVLDKMSTAHGAAWFLRQLGSSNKNYADGTKIVLCYLGWMLMKSSVGLHPVMIRLPFLFVGEAKTMPFLNYSMVVVLAHVLPQKNFFSYPRTFLVMQHVWGVISMPLGRDLFEVDLFTFVRCSIRDTGMTLDLGGLLGRHLFLLFATKFTDDEETLQEARAAKASADKIRWKGVHAMRRRKKREWRQQRFQRILAGDWSAYRDYKGEKKSSGWWGDLLAKNSSENVAAQATTHLQNKMWDETCGDWDAELADILEKIPEGDLIITESEVGVALEGMKPQAALGPDGVSVALLKRLHEEQPEALCHVVTTCIASKDLPVAWGESYLALLAKVAVPQDTSQLRPIAMSCTLQKLATRVVMGRCFPALRKPCRWAASGCGRQVADLIGAVGRFRDMCREWSIGGMVVKLDIKGAFDFLHRRAVADFMLEHLRGTHHKCELAFLLRLLRCNRLHGQAPGGAKVDVKANRGIRQGSPESAEVFGLIIQQVLVMAHADPNWRLPTGALSDLPLDSGCFQDDIVMWGDNIADMEHNIMIISRHLAALGLSLSLEKTGIVASPFYKGRRKLRVDNVVVDFLPEECSLRILGVDFSLMEGQSQQAKCLMGRIWAAWGQHSVLLRSRGSYMSKVKIVRSLVQGTWQWVAGALHWGVDDLRALNSLQVRLYRLAFGCKRYHNETWTDFNSRTCRWIRAWIFHNGVERWSTTVLRLQHQLAGHWGRQREGGFLGMAGAMLQWRNLEWWRHEQALTFHDLCVATISLCTLNYLQFVLAAAMAVMLKGRVLFIALCVIHNNHDQYKGLLRPLPVHGLRGVRHGQQRDMMNGVDGMIGSKLSREKHMNLTEHEQYRGLLRPLPVHGQRGVHRGQQWDMIHGMDGMIGSNLHRGKLRQAHGRTGICSLQGNLRRVGEQMLNGAPLLRLLHDRDLQVFIAMDGGSIVLARTMNKGFMTGDKERRDRHGENFSIVIYKIQFVVMVFLALKNKKGWVLLGQYILRCNLRMLGRWPLPLWGERERMIAKEMLIVLKMELIVIYVTSFVYLMISKRRRKVQRDDGHYINGLSDGDMLHNELDSLAWREEAASVEEDEDVTGLVQTFNIDEWQSLVNEGVTGADLGELDGYLGDLLRRVDDRGVPPHVRAQHMWGLAVLVRAVRHAIRVANVLVTLLEDRVVHGGLYQPADDADRARIISHCRGPAAIMASIHLQMMNNALDDAWVAPHELPPALREQARPPRRNPGRMSDAMMLPRPNVGDLLREGEDLDGRGRDRTPRMAAGRAMRHENALSEIPASSQGEGSLTSTTTESSVLHGSTTTTVSMCTWNMDSSDMTGTTDGETDANYFMQLNMYEREQLQDTDVGVECVEALNNVFVYLESAGRGDVPLDESDVAWVYLGKWMLYYYHVKEYQVVYLKKEVGRQGEFGVKAVLLVMIFYMVFFMAGHHP